MCYLYYYLRSKIEGKPIVNSPVKNEKKPLPMKMNQEETKIDTPKEVNYHSSKFKFENILNDQGKEFKFSENLTKYFCLFLEKNFSREELADLLASFPNSFLQKIGAKEKNINSLEQYQINFYYLLLEASKCFNIC